MIEYHLREHSCISDCHFGRWAQETNAMFPRHELDRFFADAELVINNKSAVFRKSHLATFFGLYD